MIKLTVFDLHLLVHDSVRSRKYNKITNIPWRRTLRESSEMLENDINVEYKNIKNYIFGQMVLNTHVYVGSQMRLSFSALLAPELMVRSVWTYLKMVALGSSKRIS